MIFRRFVAFVAMFGLLPFAVAEPLGAQVQLCDGLAVTIVGTQGTAGPDVIKVPKSSSKQIVDAGDGNDVVCGSGGRDLIRGGGGNDRIFGGDGKDRLIGGSGDDVIFGGPGNDTIEGGAGDDQLVGGRGNDVIKGAAGIDHIAGDVFVTQELNAELSPPGELFPSPDLFYAGDDELYGGPGRDVIDGANGDDLLDGGGGSDFLLGGTGYDIVRGGEGHDLISLRTVLKFDENLGGTVSAPSIVGGKISYSGGVGGGRIDKFVDRYFGGKGGDAFLLTADSLQLPGIAGDFFYGGPGRDTIWATGGDDKIFGNGGDDVLFGDNGDDRLVGGPGADDMRGDLGDDVCVRDASDINLQSCETIE